MGRILLDLTRRCTGLLPYLILLVMPTGCGGPYDEGTSESGRTAEAIFNGGLDRAQTLGSFLASHWELPIPPQGPSPDGRTALENSLAPEACATCHQKQHEEWRTSLHAKAYSPGFAGQLVEGEFAAPAELRQCQTCHAPLSEQQPFNDKEALNPVFDAALRKQGIVCAACHVRSHQRFGPPRRTDLSPPNSPSNALPHGGFEARPEFAESRFCAECHQFFDDPGVNGKPIQNTYVEWQASPAAADGRTCQSCHMPDRAHLWRGIHDPDMVREAVDVDLRNLVVSADLVSGELSLHNRAVGHALPTYVTARLFLAVWQEDGAGREIAGTRQEDIVGREIDFESWEEVFDTRIEPQDTRVLRYDSALHSGAAALVAQVRVDPDFHYRGVFEFLFESYESPDVLAQIDEAHRQTRESSYILVEMHRPLNDELRLNTREGVHE